ncbi:TonB-dependent receptor [Edaphobacter albus]|uniref:TonB-dependent receptor n=1 Tax=Edaphobacter sp. 4G125 TaxID=2763071 RepID=UPI0021035D27|nr:carboxypeptidase regulatory-like domain-containing protein [Edaphobacter sp. 4G125]
MTPNKKEALSAAFAILRPVFVVFAMAGCFVIPGNLLVSHAYGQASSSSDAVGRVTDSSGATVPRAIVHLTNNATGAERTATTNDNGDWSIPNLPPANYRLRIEKEGFKTSTIPSLNVEIGKTANGSVTLSVGERTETVEVSTLPPQLQTTEATVGQVIDQKQITDLPLNGRNVLQLATLAPGVSPAQGGQTGTPGQFGTRSLYITVDGGRGSSTNYVLDGTYVRSVRFNVMSLQPNTDTLQEFNLLRSTYSTEYGQGQAVVSMVTKSGTNQIHGTGYEFARNAIFDARNYFARTYSIINGQQVFNPKPDFRRHQFGGTLGFPIIKDRLFMFGGYEGQRSSKGTVLTALFPTQNELNGIWDATSSQALPGPSGPGGFGYSKTNPAGFAVTSQAALALNPTYPVLTSDATTVLGTSNYILTKPFQDNYDQYTIRGDWTMSPKSMLFGRYINFDSLQASPQVSGAVQNNPLLGRNAVLGHTYLFSSRLVNEARIGWNEFYNIGLGQLAFPGKNWASAEGLNNISAVTSPSQNGRAAFTIQNFTSAADFGGNSAGDQGDHENVISVGDSVSYVFSKHTLKGGFQFQNRRLWQIADNNARGAATFDNCTSATYAAGYKPTSPDDPNNVTSVGNCPIGQKGYQLNGTYYFYNKFQNYARGMCTSACNGNAGNSLGHYRDNTYGAFINDIWQVGHGLTVNAGMRWEYNSPWIEQNGLEGTLDPGTGLITFTKIPSVIPAAYRKYIDFSRTYQPGIVQPKKLGFMPRIGLAYEAHPGTVIRAGYGIYLDNLNTNELQFTRYAAPLYFQQSFTNVFTNGLFPDPTTNTQIPSPFSIRPDNSRPITQEWNMSLQQDLGKGLVLEIAYTGSNTHHSWKRYDQNMFIQYPFQIPTTYVRPYSQFGNGVLTSSTFGSASFNGGSVKLEKRAQNGFYYLASYQWSKNLDNFSGEAAANDSSYATTMAFDRSYSNFDTRNRAVISGGYELPFGKGKAFLQGPVSTAILGGWSFQPAVQLRTGYPFNISGSGCTFASYNGCRVFLAPGRTLASSFKSRSDRSISNWFDPTAFSQDPSVATFTGAQGAYASTARPQPNLQGWVTRNVGRGPGTASFDLSAIKSIKIRERFTTQFRAEAYNIINHGIFSNPSGALGTPSAVGKITSTSMDNRSIQLAVKVLF